MNKHALVISLLLAAVATLGACQGRDPLISQLNEDAVIEPPPPPPPPEIRTLGERRLFGTLPIENRFEDPLLTFTGTGWFAYSDSFNEYPTIKRQVGASPTQTPFVKIVGPETPSGTVLLGQVKTTTAPMHLEMWVGRDGDGASFDSVDVVLAGVFAGQGEGGVEFVADESTRTSVEGRTWVKFTADVDSGPVGWSYVIAGDSVRENTVYFGGAAAVALDANANTALHALPKRALTAKERALVEATQERTRTLAAPRRDTRPSPLPGVPAAALTQR